jgi:hypothetical protein
MSPPRLIAASLFLLAAGAALRADKHVVVIARADPEYSETRFNEEGQLRPETYVFMQGHHYPGETVDRTMERMTFREIVGYLAPELARRKYLPGPSAVEADLLLIVHWGTTRPKIGIREMTAQPTTEVDRDRLMVETMKEFGVPVEIESNFGGVPDSLLMPLGADFNQDQEFERLDRMTDELNQQFRRGDNVTLLGYADDLRRLGKRAWTGELERSLRHDLNTERYFVVIRAYDLKGRVPSVRKNRPVWTMHLNISSPGNNFRTAMNRMSVAAARYAGLNNADPATVRVTGQETTGTVALAPLVILGEAQQRN